MAKVFGDPREDDDIELDLKGSGSISLEDDADVDEAGDGLLGQKGPDPISKTQIFSERNRYLLIAAIAFVVILLIASGVFIFLLKDLPLVPTSSPIPTPTLTTVPIPDQVPPPTPSHIPSPSSPSSQTNTSTLDSNPFEYSEKTLDDIKYYTVKLPGVRSYNFTGEDPEIKRRRLAVREMFVHAYGGYEKQCFGKGEVHPVSGGCHEWLVPNMGLTIIDSMDTMLIMGLNDHYIRGRDYLKVNLHWDLDVSPSLFETNIRFLGGLLSAYDFTKDPFLLEKAKDLADRLKPAFQTPTGLPRSYVNLKTGATKAIDWAPNHASILAEVGTTQLEWSFLSALTEDPSYAETVLKAYEVISKKKTTNKLFPIYVSPDTGDLSGHVTIGGAGDSFYEYVMKYWVAIGENETDAKIGEWYYEMAEAFIDTLGANFSNPFRFAFYEGSGNYKGNKFGHLACFAGGMYALGAIHSKNETLKAKHLEVAKGVAAFCKGMYKLSQTGLPNEAVQFEPSGEIHTLDNNNLYYIQRPEAVETWFYLWRLTKDPIYRQWGWEFYEAIQKNTKKEFGYAGLRDASDPNSADDMQQSFFLAETLKYLYLLFCPDDVIPLDKFVFNTEAHPYSHFKAMYHPVL